MWSESIPWQNGEGVLVNNALVGFQTGTLVDSDILTLASTGNLIVDEFVPANVKQACYELRASDVFWETWSTHENKRVVVDATAGYLLKPNRYVVAIVKEKIVLPPNIVARILAKGQLVSIGVLPADLFPFLGNLKIV